MNADKNPFDIVKATDFDDVQIKEYWVDIPGDNGFINIIKPTSPMPMIIKGGKGSGKTHLLRYFSYKIRKLTCESKSILEQIKKDGYFGVFIRCSGLNANRFYREGIETDWDNVFKYYFDLWVAQILLDDFQLFLSDTNIDINETFFCKKILSLFDKEISDECESIEHLLFFLNSLQKDIDYKINNCVLQNKLNVEILCSPGRLVFGIPQTIKNIMPVFENNLFVYLIDELENFDINQQKYIQTLIREKESPSTIKVGVRSHGIKTYKTLSGDEVNRVGSEFEALHLEASLRENQKYSDFAKELCLSRLRESSIVSNNTKVKDLAHFFESKSIDEYASENNNPSDVLLKFKKKLLENIEDIEFINAILEKVSDENVLRQKAKIYKFYSNYKKKKDVLKVNYEDIEEVMSHYKNDFFAQMNNSQPYAIYTGLDSIIEISEGFPRLFLTLLKHIYSKSLFNNETPFSPNTKISIKSQYYGIRESSSWFYSDARMEGVDGTNIKRVISNLIEIFNINRYSDKPIECSLISFNLDEEAADENVIDLLNNASDWALLINLPVDSKDKNSDKIIKKYAINRMLSAKFNLPISIRGSLKIPNNDIPKIFGSNNLYSEYRSNFKKRVNFPFPGKKTSSDNKKTNQINMDFNDDDKL